MSLYLLGEISKDRIDYYIGSWHDDEHSDLSLAQWLGMSDKMYCMFVETPEEFFERYNPNPSTLIDKR